MMPSRNPSRPSHASTTALVSVASFAAGTIGAPSFWCVTIHECRKPNVWRMRLCAGSPAMMPS
jgi:hypothetical protein